ncbi:MAG: xanthine dehydrogenase family protein molybdopterin-binding subunit [Deltaproteobacteria bacterium]|nr:xanthine dehydrogenase family protein molybdopterin-binding subunit [Deltaproteobacteria bacterium]
MGTQTRISRRTFLKAAALSGAGLAIGISPDSSGRTPHEGQHTRLAGWVKIGSDDTVTVLISRSEMGQGISTALAMVVAEELEADWTKVRTEWAPVTPEYAPQATGASKSIRTLWKRLLIAGAAAREMLIEAAARTWEVGKETCVAERGFVVHRFTGRRLAYGSLAEKASGLEIPKWVDLKNPKDYRLVGKPLPRLDTPEKVRGEAIYCWDLKVSGMLVATVARCPVLGGWVKEFDAEAVEKIEGVRYVVPLFNSSSASRRQAWAYLRSADFSDSSPAEPKHSSQDDNGPSDAAHSPRPQGTDIVAIAVVAENFWSAKRGRDALQVEWENGPNATRDSGEIAGIFDSWSREGPGKTIVNRGDVRKAEAGCASKLSAVYQAPYLAHATPEPMCCVADVRRESAEVWAPTQDPWESLTAASQWAGLPSDAVQLHKIRLGGGFGRRLVTDFVAEAVQISKSIGTPVKVLWSREDDIRHDYYRPATSHNMSAGVDESGRPTFWRHRIAGLGSHVQLLTGADEIPYAIPDKVVELVQGKMPEPVKTGAHRGVGHVQNAFAIECFMDEIAASGKNDPFELRRKLLAGSPRHKAVLELAASKADWGGPLPEGIHRGIAMQAHEVGSIAAQVAEVSIEKENRVRVHRVVCAVDCGRVVNPSIVTSQITGGILFGLSGALKEEITLHKGRVVQSNFHDYPLLGMDEIPEIIVHTVPSREHPVGVGELGVLPVAAAVANAVFAATGKPVRRLPIRLA